MVLRQSSLSIWFWDPPQKQKSLDSQVPKIKWYRSSIYNQSTLDPTLGIHLHIRIPQTRKANCIFKIMQPRPLSQFRNVFTSLTKKHQTLGTKLHALSHVSPRQPLMWFLSHLSILDISHKCNYTSCCWRMLLKTTHSFTTVAHHGCRAF